MGAFYAWCLLLDRSHNPSLGEPFPVSVRADDTIHELRVKITTEMSGLGGYYGVAPNRVEIWKSKSSSLSANDSFDRTKKQLSYVSFDDNENNDIQQLGAALRVMDLKAEDNELWLALMPRDY